MDFGAMWNKVSEITNSYLPGVFLLAVAAVISIRAMRQKNIKLKRLMADNRFRGSKPFAHEIKSPLVISPDGYIGVVIDTVSTPVVTDIRELTKITVTSNDSKIAGTDEDDPEGLLFTDIAARAAFGLKQKTKRINLILLNTVGQTLNIPLFTSTLRKAVELSEAKQTAIKQLLKTLEEVEKRVKL
jgi:hypothetical protein